MRASCIALVLVPLGAGCGSEEPDGDDASASSSSSGGAGGCAPGELAREGACVAPGVPPDACAPGFEHDGDAGCRAVLPAEPCPWNTMALPGELACRAVAPCSESHYGEAPIDQNTVFVDASYAGADSDGSADRPWTTLEDGLAAANEMAVIALAAGTYWVTDFLGGKPVRIWGRCPELTEIRGEASLFSFGALAFAEGMDGSELHDLSIRSHAIGLGISGSRDILVERVLIEGAATNAIELQDVLGPASVEVRGCLIEASEQLGIALAGGEATIADTVVRGRETGERSAGLAVDLHPQTGSASRATVVGSFFDRTTDAIQVISGELEMEGTLVRDTTPGDDGTLGRALEVRPEKDTTRRAKATVRSSVLEDNHDVGIYVAGSDLTVESTVIRGTRPGSSLGRGISAQGSPVVSERALLVLRTSLVAGNHDQGVRVASSDATIESIVVRDTQPGAGDLFGRGVVITADPTSYENATATVRGCRIERSLDVGLIVISAQATIEDTLVTDTVPRVADGAYGDGFAVLSITEVATATITRCAIERSARAGAASFGGVLSLANTTIGCSAFPLDGEQSSFLDTTYDFQLQDLGGNTCSCEGDSETCKVVTSSLAAPDGLTP